MPIKPSSTLFAGSSVAISSNETKLPWQRRVLNLLPSVLDVLGITSGAFGAGWLLLDPATGLIGLWFEKALGWELNAFAAFGTMSGFGLASMALVASLSGHKRAEEEIESENGRFLLKMLLVSTWAWLLPALLALSHVLLQRPIVVAAFILAACWGVARGILALMAFSFFFSRFTKPKA